VLITAILALAYLFYKYSSEEQFNARARYFFSDPFEEIDSNIALGSSSIAKLDLAILESCGPWVNRGIGKAQIEDIAGYIEDSQLKVNPKMILLYAGENDIRYGKSLNQTISEYKALVDWFSENYSDSEIHLMAIKLSPKRERHWKEYLTFNQQIENWSLKNNRLFWHNHRLSDLDKKNSISRSFFQKDELHLSPKGYGEFIKGIKTSCQKN